MKIGLSRPYSDPGHPVPDVDMGLVAQYMESAGFQWLSVGHHTVRPLNEAILGVHTGGVPLYQDPLIAAARATALTQRLEVATGVLIMPMQHPVNVAKQAACIDLYSGGRFILGLGTGGASRMEIEASGGRWDRRWDYTMESVEVMKGLWTDDAFSFKGDFFDIPPVVMGPRPASRPHTRIALGGYSDAVLRRVARHCDGWLPAYAGTKLLNLSGSDITGPEHVREGRRKLHRFAEEAGREVGHFEISVILAAGDEDRDLIRLYEDAGADRVSISLPSVSSEQDARNAVDTIACRIL